MILKTQTPKIKMQLSHYFLHYASLMGGVATEIDVSDFSQILAFDSGRKTIMPTAINVKLCMKTLFSRFRKEMQQILGH